MIASAFFLIGERIVSDGNEALVLCIRDEGHELGNHMDKFSIMEITYP
jgi:peptidoglycan/xylan/chitin deacetylase (PgdA/CDA1 family)